MRVAIVAESFLPNVNGVTNSVLRVLEHLRRTGHEALVIAPDTPRGEPPADRVHDGVRVHRVPSRMFPKITSLPLGVPRPRMVGVLRGFDPDVVHLASPALLGYGGLHAARHLGVPTVAVFQTDVAGFAESYGVGGTARAAWAWTRHLHSRADRTLAPSTAAIENLEAHRVPRVRKWGRGVDVTGFAPSARDEQLRRRWSPHGKPIVGFVGRLAPEKHVERLAALARRDDLQLVVVGDGVDRRKLENLLPSAYFTGALYGDELAAAYASMDVFVHPGEHETFCQAVQEAMASGLPVIAPNAGGPRDLVAPYRTGLLLEVDSFEARLPESVDHLIAERQRYSVAARRSVLSRTWPAICDELLSHYDDVVALHRERACLHTTRRANSGVRARSRRAESA
ncbi:glycosyltransferase family 1 protein [Mycolicibacterium flavescens]|uniref:glycosyltransferase family 4 protein n=1 Tax=Mycolicibacterium flavescens TaxID=1776 RepID=UPI000A01FC45|nr:glycosyltransferase family 1 protein [Mycolicibacterium flavescens]MCV7278412.1 glycosyltransferase family 1 protein [Mycolicibacterium flavescens]